VARGVRSLVFFRRKPPLVPDPGQRVRLRTARGLWRGNFRAISGPHTTDDHQVVVWVAKEVEYRRAIRQGRRAIGMPWPVEQVAVVLPSEDAGEAPQEVPQVAMEDVEEKQDTPEQGVSRRVLEQLERYTRTEPFETR
jgi:hypothetical protein